MPSCLLKRNLLSYQADNIPSRRTQLACQSEYVLICVQCPHVHGTDFRFRARALTASSNGPENHCIYSRRSLAARITWAVGIVKPTIGYDALTRCQSYCSLAHNSCHSPSTADAFDHHRVHFPGVIPQTPRNADAGKTDPGSGGARYVGASSCSTIQSSDHELACGVWIRLLPLS